MVLDYLIRLCVLARRLSGCSTSRLTKCSSSFHPPPLNGFTETDGGTPIRLPDKRLHALLGLQGGVSRTQPGFNTWGCPGRATLAASIPVCLLLCLYICQYLSCCLRRTGPVYLSWSACLRVCRCLQLSVWTPSAFPAVCLPVCVSFSAGVIKKKREHLQWI